jgi:hypothetical protein
MDSSDAAIEHILDGGDEWPDPFQNAKMNVWRGQAMFLRVSRGPGAAPEETLERLREWVVQSAWIVSQSEQQPTMPPVVDPMAVAPGAMPPDAGPVLPGAGVAPANLIT